MTRVNQIKCTKKEVSSILGKKKIGIVIVKMIRNLEIKMELQVIDERC